MNPYRVIIICALIATYLIQILSEWLNIKSLQLGLPRELECLYDAEKYRASQEYTRERTRFGFIESTFSLIVLIVLWFFHFAGDRAWLYCWIVSIAFLLVIQFIAPIWLMPLFNKFTPLPDGELKEKLFEYCRSVRFGFRDIFVVDGSRRSSKAN